MKTLVIACSLVLLLVGSCSYSVIGTEGRVSEIRQRATIEIPARGWDIMRYEGYQRGSFSKHGGKVWYHVRNVDDHSIQYRVMITLWNNELHYCYGKPEELNRINVNL